MIYDGDSPFYKEKKENIIWRFDSKTKGEFWFTFDQEKAYNFWEDWDKLTDEQKEIFRKEFPTMAALKD